MTSIDDIITPPEQARMNRRAAALVAVTQAARDHTLHPGPSAEVHLVQVRRMARKWGLEDDEIARAITEAREEASRGA